MPLGIPTKMSDRSGYSGRLARGGGVGAKYEPESGKKSMPVLCMVLGYAALVSEWGFESFGGRLWTARELDFRVPAFV